MRLCASHCVFCSQVLRVHTARSKSGSWLTLPPKYCTNNNYSSRKVGLLRYPITLITSRQNVGLIDSQITAVTSRMLGLLRHSNTVITRRNVGFIHHPTASITSLKVGYIFATQVLQ